MKDNNIRFDYSDDYGNRRSSSQRATHYEDIVSDSQYSYLVGGKPVKSHGKKPVRRRRKKNWWQRLSKRKKTVFISVTSVVLVLAILLGWFFITFRYRYNNITDNPDALGFSEVIDKKIVNVALFGIDTRDEKSFSGNSDSIMILSINTETKKVKVISIMRDTLAPIERNGSTTYYKINAAYGWGGPELAIKTLNQNFGLDISEYATVNFYGMSDIIDAVGGIDATLTDREVSARGENNHGINDMIGELCSYLKLNPQDYYVTQSGEQHLNGVQAVAYARIRYVPNIWGTNNDYGRTDRQRYVMEQLFNKAKTLSKTQYAKLAKALIPCSETSLSYSEIMSLAFSVLLHSPTFEQARIPQDNFQMTSPKGSFGSVVYYDLAYAAKVIHAFIYDDISVEDYVAANGIEKNDWYGHRYSGGSGNSGGSGSTGGSSTKPSTSSDSTDSTTSQVTSKPTTSDTPSETTSSDVSSTVESTGGETSGGESTGGETSGGESTGGETSGGESTGGDPTPSEQTEP